MELYNLISILAPANLILFRFNVLSCGGGWCTRARQRLRWQIVEPCRRASWSLTTFLRAVSTCYQRLNRDARKAETYWVVCRNLALKFVQLIQKLVFKLGDSVCR